MKNKPINDYLLIGIIALILSFFTVYLQEQFLGLKFFETEQLDRHQAVMSGIAGSPWQYRVLSDYLVEIVISVISALKISRPIAVSFLLFRLFQNLLIFVTFAFYLKAFKFNKYIMLIGMAILAWGMSLSFYDSDLQFGTYFDIFFYILAGWLMLNKKYYWIIPVTVLAALNRETSGLIPVILLAFFWPFKVEPENSKKILTAGLVSLGLYGIIIIGLRLIFPSETLISVYGESLYGADKGISMIIYNFSRLITWSNLFGTLNIIPIIALLLYRKWPEKLRATFWAVIPLWFIIHSSMALIAETRVFLAPQALIFIPAALMAFKDTKE